MPSPAACRPGVTDWPPLLLNLKDEEDEEGHSSGAER